MTSLVKDFRVIPGTVKANAPVVANASKAIDDLTITTLNVTTPSIGGVALGSTAAEIDAVCDRSGRIVNVTSSTATITQATYSDRIVTLNRAAGIAVTLPAASGLGSRYTFFVGTTVTSNTTTIKVANASDIMYGQIIAASTGDTPDLAQPWVTAADSDTVTLDGTTTGGIKGDYIQFIDVASNAWLVIGFTSCSGTEATPFSATV